MKQFQMLQYKKQTRKTNRAVSWRKWQTCLTVLSVQGLNTIVILYLALNCSYRMICLDNPYPSYQHLNMTVMRPKPEANINQIQRTVFPLIDLKPFWDKIPFEDAPHFPRLVKQNDRDKMVKLLGAVDTLFKEHGVEYVMYWGTLLGSYMSHGPLAWDDDLDLMANSMDLLKIVRLNRTGVLKTKGLGYVTQGRGKTQLDYTAVKMKIFPLDGDKINGYSWRWPFVDITPYESNITHVWNFNRLHKPIVIPKLFMYPTNRRPFGPYWLPAPRDSFLALRANYLNTEFGKQSAFVCQRSYWHHMNETWQKMLQVPCGSLTPYYPFVRREKIEGGVRETLELDDEPIYSVDIAEPFHFQKYPYRLPW